MTDPFDINALGPIRFHAVDKDMYPVEHRNAGPADVWMLMCARPFSDDRFACCWVPIPSEDDHPKSLWWHDFEHGFLTLCDIQVHPELYQS